MVTILEQVRKPALRHPYFTKFLGDSWWGGKRNGPPLIRVDFFEDVETSTDRSWELRKASVRLSWNTAPH